MMISTTQKREREEDDEAHNDTGLSTELQDPQKIEAFLKTCGFLDPTMGVREYHASRDPVLGIIYSPTLPLNDDGTTIIDHLLCQAHQHFARTYGRTYTEFALITDTMEILLGSKDTRSKQIMFLFMIGIDEGLQTQMQCTYAADGVERKRFPVFLSVLRNEMAALLNTAFVNTPGYHPFSVDVLGQHFMRQICTGYPGI